MNYCIFKQHVESKVGRLMQANRRLCWKMKTSLWNVMASRNADIVVSVME